MKNWLRSTVAAGAVLIAGFFSTQANAQENEASPERFSSQMEQMAFKPEFRSGMLGIDKSAQIGQGYQEVSEPEIEIEPEPDTNDSDEDENVNPTPQPTLTAGQMTNAQVQAFADDVYQQADNTRTFLREHFGNGLGEIANIVPGLGLNLVGLGSQGSGYVAQAAVDGWNGLAEITGNAWESMFGSNDEEPEVEVEPENETPTPTPQNDNSEQEQPVTPTAEEEKGIGDEIGEFFTQTAPDAVKTAAGATGQFFVDGYNAAADGIGRLFSSDEQAPAVPEGTQVEQEEVAPVDVLEVQAEQPTTPTAEEEKGIGDEIGQVVSDGLAATGEALETGWNATAEGTQELAESFQENVNKPVYDNVLKPVGEGIADGYNAVVDGVTGLFSSDEQTPTVPEGTEVAQEEIAQVQPEAIQAQTPTTTKEKSAWEKFKGLFQTDKEVQKVEGRKIYYTGNDSLVPEQNADPTVKSAATLQAEQEVAQNAVQEKDFGDKADEFLEGVGQSIENGWDSTYDNVLKPVGDVVEGAWNDVVDHFTPADEVPNVPEGTEVAQVQPEPEQPATPTVEEEKGIGDEIGKFFTQTAPDAVKTAAGATGQFFVDGYNAVADGITGLTEAPKVTKDVAPVGLDKDAVASENINKLQAFLKSKNMSDEDIAQAVAIMQGKDATQVEQAVEKTPEKTGTLKDTLASAQQPYSFTGKEPVGTITVDGMIKRNAGR